MLVSSASVGVRVPVRENARERMRVKVHCGRFPDTVLEDVEHVNLHRRQSNYDIWANMLQSMSLKTLLLEA